MPVSIDQTLPASGLLRERRRQQGQFWTPGWIADAMVGYALADRPRHIFDPAVGAGAFFVAAKQWAQRMQTSLQLQGREIDTVALAQARQNGLSADDLAGVTVGDFVLNPPAGSFQAIVANPPYIRHHRLSPHVKAHVRRLGADLMGQPLDGRAGLHVYFLLRALQLLAPGARLAFIIPADTCEGVFATQLWRWITHRYCLEAVVTFAEGAAPFAGVDTNALIVMIRNATPSEQLWWVRCAAQDTRSLTAWSDSRFRAPLSSASFVYQRQLTEALATGLSRKPTEERPTGPALGDFAQVRRGIATGANDFFLLTFQQAASLGLPPEFFLTAVARTRDVSGSEVNVATLQSLEQAGRPTRLLSLDGRSVERFPRAVRNYLHHGEALQLHRRPLLATRRPWYKMETRVVPPILFAYLGRRNSRFVRNRAGVMPLTGFLCVYPRQSDEAFIERLWRVLNHPDTIANLVLVGKSYGGGAIKVEPRALERLPLPEAVVSDAGLRRNGQYRATHNNQMVMHFVADHQRRCGQYASRTPVLRKGRKHERMWTHG